MAVAEEVTKPIIKEYHETVNSIDFQKLIIQTPELDQAMSTINSLEKQKYDLVTQLSEHASGVLKLKSKNK